MLYLLLVEWKDAGLALTILIGLAAVTAALAFLVATWRIKREDTWRQLAERRGAERDELKKKIETVEGKLKHTETELERFMQWYFQELAKAKWYERRYGPIPPDADL